MNQLLDYFETIWKQQECGYFHNDRKLAHRESGQKAILELKYDYQCYFKKNYEKKSDDYTDETYDTQQITLLFYAYQLKETCCLVSIR